MLNFLLNFVLSVLLTQLAFGPLALGYPSRAERFETRGWDAEQPNPSQLQVLNRIQSVLEKKGFFDLSDDLAKARLLELYQNGVNRLVSTAPRVLNQLSEGAIDQVWTELGERAQHFGSHALLEKWNLLNTSGLEKRERLEVLLGYSAGREAFQVFSRELAQEDSIASYFENLERSLTIRKKKLPFVAPFPATYACASNLENWGDFADGYGCFIAVIPFALIADVLITPFILVWDVLLAIGWLFIPGGGFSKLFGSSSKKSNSKGGRRYSAEFDLEKPKQRYGGG